MSCSEKKEYYELINIGLKNNEILKNCENITFYSLTIYLNPFIEDDELEELAKVLANVSNDKSLKRDFANLNITCYCSAVQIDLTEILNKDEVLSEIKPLVEWQGEKAKIELDSFHENLSLLNALSQSETGEWYFIIHDNDFAEDFKKMVDELGIIHRLNPLDNYEARGYSYSSVYNSDSGSFTDYIGYTGDCFSVYKNSYSPENKLSEGLFIGYHSLYDDIFCKMIYDFTLIRPYSNSVDFSSEISFKNGELGMYVDWREYKDYLSVDKLSDITFRLYKEVWANANINDCLMLNYFDIRAVSPSGMYNVEVDELYSIVNIKKVFTKEEWEQELRKGLSRKFIQEPV